MAAALPSTHRTIDDSDSEPATGHNQTLADDGYQVARFRGRMC